MPQIFTFERLNYRKSIIVLILFFYTSVYAQFEPLVPLACSLNPQSSSIIVLTDDLDNDGDQDVISSGPQMGNIIWSENLGNDIFSTPKSISGFFEQIYPKSISIVDLNGDGKKDVLASILSGDNIVWYENQGQGEFSDKKNITTLVYNSRSITASDLDNDGDLDVVSASYGDDKIAWYENDGFGNFGVQQVISIIDGPLYIVTADIDNNGYLDIVVSSYFNQNIVWCSNQGGNNFLAPQTITSSNLVTYSFCLIDDDGDNDEDVFTVDFTGNKFSKYQNLGTGVFGSEQIISTAIANPKMLKSKDIDSDGDLDFIISENGDNKVLWFENLSGGSYIEHLVTSGFLGSNSIWSDDLDNDGDNDVLATSETNFVSKWYENNGGIFSLPKELFSSVDGPLAILAVNIDNDSLIDIVSSSGYDHKIVFNRNIGNNEYESQVIISNSAYNVYSLSSFDVDGDAWVDIITANYTGDSICWMKNLNGVGFGPKTLISNQCDLISSIFSCDLDQDGDMDLLSSSVNDDKIAWYENLGGFFGTQQVISLLANGPKYVVASDLNGDGLLDVLSASAFDNKIAWYPNLNGSFGTQQVISVQASNAKVVLAADLDNDGDEDVFSASSNDNKVAWYENLGGGIFGPQSIISNQTTNVGVLNCTDVDVDGKIDLLVGYGNTFSWFKNLGGGQFTSEMIISTNANAINSINFNDLDNDGDNDFLVSGFNNNIVGYIKNGYLNAYQARGTIYLDENQNGIFEGTEEVMHEIPVFSSPDYSFAFTDLNGNYYMNFSQPTNDQLYQIQPLIPNDWLISSDSLVYNVLVDGAFMFSDSLNFGIYPDVIETSIETNITGGFPSCNDTINLWLNVHNIGSTLPSGIIHLELNDSLIFLSASATPDSIFGQHLYWSYDSLFYFSHENLDIQVKMPDFNSMGDTLYSYLNVSALSSASPTIISQDTLTQLIVCAYDPNDKIAFPPGITNLGYISSETLSLEYTIRFQNTGTDTANSIVIKDFLDSNLIWQSIVPISSSDPFNLSFNPNGEISFSFFNINLPDSNVNFIESQGFIKYRVNLHPNLPAGTTIENTAYIYFDLNPAVITNTQLNTIVDCPMIRPAIDFNQSLCEKDTFFIFTEEPNVHFEMAFVDSTYNFIDQLELISDSSGIFNINLNYSNSLCQYDSILNLTINEIPTVEINQQLPTIICKEDEVLTLPESLPLLGIYSGNGIANGYFDPSIVDTGSQVIYYSFISSFGCYAIDSITVYVDSCSGLGIFEFDDFHVKIIPNPFSESATIQFNIQMDGEFDFILSNLFGQVLLTEKKILGNQLVLNKGKLTSGVYTVQLINQAKQYIWTSKIVIE